MEEIVLSSGSDTESEIEIILSKPAKEIIILENESKRRRLEVTRRSELIKNVSQISSDASLIKKKSARNLDFMSKNVPKIVEVCPAKQIEKNQQSIQDYLLSLLSNSYVIKNLKYEENGNLSFSDEIFNKFSCWDTNISSHYLNLFLSWIKISNSKSIELCELINLFESFLKTGLFLKSTENELSEFLVKFSQCIKTISLKIDNHNKKSQINLEKFLLTKRRINDFLIKILKSLCHTNFKMFSTFYKIIYDIYRVYSLFLFKLKLKYLNDPIILTNYFRPDEKFIKEIIDHFQRCVFLFEKNTELVLINIKIKF